MSFPVTTMTHTGTTVSTSSVTIAAASAQRTYLMIQNQGAVSVYIRLDGGTAVADKTALRLLPGESYEVVGFLPASLVTAIAASSCDVHVVAGAPPA